MSDFLFELFCEEIPAQMQLKAQNTLKDAFVEALKDACLSYGSVTTWITPRRMGVFVNGLLETVAAQEDIKRGPKLGANVQAIEGFLKANSLKKDDLYEEGDYYYARVIVPAKDTSLELVTLTKKILADFTWPKVMRYPQSPTPWVRPVRNILALFDGKILSLDLFGLKATDQTFGNRFMAPEAIKVCDFEGYKQSLKNAFVVYDHATRQEMITQELQKACDQKGLVLQEDQALVEEVAGLCEWPFVKIGSIDLKFLDLPTCVLSTSMKVHQKYFTLLTKEQTPAPFFAYATNREFKDPLVSQKGFEKVLRARLSDALFFFEQDKKIPLESQEPHLEKIIFHKELGTLLQKVDRLQKLVDSDLSKRAALLCKSDLLSSMVGEFPELQGKMGSIYALHQGEDAKVANAIVDHYSPMGPSDRCPADETSYELALADKIDTLIGFFGINQLPTGSKDPYGLRRCALGIIRLIQENNLKDFDLFSKLCLSCELYAFDKKIANDVYAFILSRLEGALKGINLAPTIIQACVGTLNPKDYPTQKASIWSLIKRAQALNSFMHSSEGQNLLHAYTRAIGIIKGEEKKQKTLFEAFSSLESLKWEDEQDSLLGEKINTVNTHVQILLKDHSYEESMSVLSSLRTVMDEYFEKTTIITPDKELSANRLRLLSTFVTCVHAIAVLSFLNNR